MKCNVHHVHQWPLKAWLSNGSIYLRAAALPPTPDKKRGLRYVFTQLLFPPAAAAAAPALATPSVQKTAPGWENTMALKDGKASKLRPKTP